MFGCNIGGFAHWGGWFPGIGFLLASAFVAWLAIRLTRKKPCNTDRVDSLAILKMRLAKGEITLEEYTALKSVL